MRLSKTKVKAVTKPGRYWDSAYGLCLQVTKTGGKSWMQRLTIRGRRRDLGLGNILAYDLDEVRELAFENWRTAKRGGDPTGESDKAPTFAEAAETVIEIQTRDTAAGNEREWRASLTRYAFPVIGDVRVDEVTSGQVMEILAPIWASKRTTAKRLRSRMSTIFKWSIAQAYRTHDPAGEAISGALPRTGNGVVHHKAIHHGDIQSAVVAIRNTAGNPFPRLAVEFVILTAARSGEVRGMTWDEVDTVAATWTVPGARMKAKREHVVPLSRRALAILEEARELSDGSGLVFPNTKGAPLQAFRFTDVLKAAKVDGTLHGMRSTFRDWCAERGVDRAVAEQALAHVVGGVEGAYNRTTLIERRRPLMEDWCAHCEGEAAKVVHIHHA